MSLFLAHGLCLSINPQVSYQIYVDDKRIYSLATNWFARDNQICYIFRNQTERNAVIRIRLLANTDCSFKNFNGVIDVKHVMLTKNKEISADDKVFSTYHQYKSMVTGQS